MSATDETVWPDGWPSRIGVETHPDVPVRKVYLNGERVPYPVEEDRSEGWVRAWKTDTDGNPIFVNEGTPDVEPVFEVLRGEVRVEFWRDAAP